MFMFMFMPYLKGGWMDGYRSSYVVGIYGTKLTIPEIDPHWDPDS